MTYEQFWEQDCALVKAYRKAAKIKRDIKNQDAWLQGAYFYEALLDASPILHAFAKKGTKPTPYRSEPYELFAGQDAQEREAAEQKSDDKAKQVMEAFTMSVNRKFLAKGGEKSGG